MAMPAIKIDTLEMAKELEAAGIPPKHAEAQTRAYAKIVNLIEDQILIKPDLLATESRLEKQINQVEGRLDQRITETENKLEKRINEVEIRLDQRITELGQRITLVETNLRQEIEKLSLQLTLRLGGLLMVGVTALALIIKL